MRSTQLATPKEQLSWQVPVEEPLKLRTTVLRFAFAGLICLGVLLLFGSRAFRIAALLGAIPFAWFVVWRAKRKSQRQSVASDNVRLDGEGLHWQDARGTERRIDREHIEGFRIGLDPDTMRALPALTLILAGGFESQPVELHSPVGPSHVRQFLVEQMHVGEIRQDDNFAKRLRDALEAACESESHLSEMRVLRFGLLNPELLPDGSWLVARLIDGHEISVLPDSCRYRCCHDDSTVELDDLAQLGEYIRGEILARRKNESVEWLSTLDQQQLERDELAVRRDASRLGFYVECDPEGRLHFEGARPGLLALFHRLEDAVQRLRQAPLGARPESIHVGGSAVRLEVMLDEVPWHDQITMAGPRSYLRAVAEAIRSRLEYEVATDFFVKVEHRDFAPETFGVHLRGDDYDPLCEFAAKVDTRRNV